MGAFVNYFKNLGSKIKTGISDWWGKVKKDPMHIVRTIAGGLSYLPGLIGKGIGMATKVYDTVKNGVNALPDSKIKDKMTEMVDKTGNVIDKGKEIGGKVSDTSEKLGKALGSTAPPATQAATPVKSA